MQSADVGTIEVAAEDGEGIVWRYRKSQPHITAPAEAKQTKAEADEPSWLHEKVAPDPVRAVAITLSDADEIGLRGTHATLERKQALLRGRLMHRLIQSPLPDLLPAVRADAAQEIPCVAMPTISPPRNARPSPHRRSLSWRMVSSPRSCAGQPCGSALVGTLAGASRPLIVNGQIDRLVVTADEILIADYKTNRPAPTALDAVPRPYKRQLALYRALLQRIIPAAPSAPRQLVRTGSAAIHGNSGRFLMQLADLTSGDHNFDPAGAVLTFANQALRQPLRFER